MFQNVRYLLGAIKLFDSIFLSIKICDWRRAARGPNSPQNYRKYLLQLRSDVDIDRSSSGEAESLLH